MSSTALRAVRELRGDSGGGDGRPFTPRGDRPGTATAAGGLRAASPDALSPAAVEALKKELDDTRMALEKEKRSEMTARGRNSAAATATATAPADGGWAAHRVWCLCSGLLWSGLLCLCVQQHSFTGAVDQRAD